MFREPIPLVRPSLDRDDLNVMQEAVQSGLITEGDLTRALEKDFVELLSASGAVATNSGTSALVLALRTLQIGPGDQVIIPSYTCVAVLNAVIQVGAEPCLVDNAYHPTEMDYNISPNAIRKKLNRRTRAIIVPHMFGVPAAIDEIAAFGIPIIEDGTLCLGARYRERPVGSWGQISVFSLHASKMIAAGEGGILIANDPDLYRRAQYLNSWSEEQKDERMRSEDSFTYELRYNFRLSDILAALARNQLRKLPRFISQRRQLAQKYLDEFADLPYVQLPSIANHRNVFQRFLIALNLLKPVDVIREFLAAGIEVGRGVFPPLHRMLKLSPHEFPSAERAIKTLISLPLYPDLQEDEVGLILATTKKVLVR